MVPVATQMVMAAKHNQNAPVITVPKAGDSAKMKTVKSIINKMVVYDANKRISAAEAARETGVCCRYDFLYFGAGRLLTGKVGKTEIVNMCATHIIELLQLDPHGLEDYL